MSWDIKKCVHLWDLNDGMHTIYVKIEEKQRMKLFNDLLKVAKNVHNLSRLIGLEKINNFKKYQRGEISISLELLENLLSVFKDDKRKKFIATLEKESLKEIKMGAIGKPIINPKFPVKFCPSLARIAGHLAGDGGVANKIFSRQVYYTNSCDTLLREFKNDMLQVFGNINFKEYVDKRDGSKTIKYPGIIGIILIHLLGEQVGKLKHVPKIIQMSDKTHKALFLRALFDDESNVDISSYRIPIEMSNKSILSDVRKMLMEFGIKPGKLIKVTSKRTYVFSITHRNNLDIFRKCINFDHSKKKKKLAILLSKYKQAPRRRRGEFIREVILLLRRQEMNIFDIAKALNYASINGLRKELWKLEKKGIIQSKKLRNEKVKKIFYVKSRF